MFEDIFWFFIIFIISYFAFFIISRYDLGPFSIFLKLLGLIGVIIHELSHFIICKLVGVQTDGISIKYWYKGRANPHGRVKLKYIERDSFMQDVLISLAPLYISTWLFFWSLTIMFIPDINTLFKISAGLFCLSVIIGAAPSATDLKGIPVAFKRDPVYSMYQILLVVLSGLIVWIIVETYQIFLPFFFLYYVIIAFFYFLLKYGFRGTNKLIHNYIRRSKSKFRVSNFNYKSFTRKRVKPPQPYKFRLEEAQW